jgi:large subunit ribosomal protein L9
VPKIGQKGDVKDLKEGYVRNMLLPRQLAKIATTGELNSLKKQQEFKEEYQNAESAKISDIFKKLDGQVVDVKEKSNEKGHLFAKVGKDEVVFAVKSQMKVAIDPEWFELDPIKEIGDYVIKLKFEKLSKEFTLRVK